MSGPKHLWAGEWEQESAAAARERARRRPAPAEAPDGPLGQPPAPERAPAPSPRLPWHVWLRARLAAARRGAGRIPRPSGPVMLAGLAGFLIIVAVALAVNTLSGDSGAAHSRATPFLGLELESVPVNRVLVSAVVPGSPADRAGLGPGDVIVSIDDHPVQMPGDVTSAIAPLHAGQTIKIEFQRGPLTMTTQATLGPPQGPGSP